MINVNEKKIKVGIYKAALAAVNRLRKEYNIGKPLTKLPKGKWGDNTSCPIQRALNCLVVDDLVITWSCNATYRNSMCTPEKISDFILAFDDHKYPELEE